MKIYTKTGDKGQTSLIGGVRVPKCCERLESYGTVDELNSNIGLLITYCTDRHDVNFLIDVQTKLFVIGSYLATDQKQTALKSISVVTDDMVSSLETEIDSIEAVLPPVRLFVLPGGCRTAALCHVCRTVCRRAERSVLRLQSSGCEVDDNVIAFLNRLSDYLFVLARKLNVNEGHEEIIWHGGK